MRTAHRLGRRRLLKRALAAAAAPYVLTSGALAAPGRRGANDRINIASIGIRNMGGGHLRALLGNGDVRVVAICDVDSKIRQGGLDRAKAAYGDAKVTEGYGDFRHVLARDDVDAVVIAVPDHWHAPISIAACEAGKDVYCEKPMTLTVKEGRAMVDAVRRHCRVFQTGTQRRSSSNWRFACELVRSKRIGDLVKVETSISTRPDQVRDWQAEPVPPELDYEMWLGPAPWQPYTKNRCHYNFRFIRDYSGGEMTNTGAHWFDIAQWGIGADETGPVEVEGTGQYHSEGLWDTFHHLRVEWTYASRAKLICTNSGPSVRFTGTEGWVSGDGRSAEPASILTSAIGPNDIRLYRTNRGHMGTFLHCMRTREDPSAPAEVGHRSATVCHIGNIALTLQRKLTWDPVKEEFPDDDEANRLLWRPYRQPWRL
jgi:predicted dehydrogenase